jgi:hypothetical protein
MALMLVGMVRMGSGAEIDNAVKNAKEVFALIDANSFDFVMNKTLIKTVCLQLLKRTKTPSGVKIS